MSGRGIQPVGVTLLGGHRRELAKISASEETEHSAKPLVISYRGPSPKATKKLRDRVRELTSKRESGKEVKPN